MNLKFWNVLLHRCKRTKRSGPKTFMLQIDPVVKSLKLARILSRYCHSLYPPGFG